MQKKRYIHPETEILRDIHGEVVMAPIDAGLAGSPSHGQTAPALRPDKGGAPFTF